MVYYGNIIPQSLYNEIYSFKIQLYLFILLSLALLIYRATIIDGDGVMLDSSVLFVVLSAIDILVTILSL